MDSHKDQLATLVAITSILGVGPISLELDMSHHHIDHVRWIEIMEQHIATKGKHK